MTAPLQAWDGRPVKADAREVDEAFVLAQLLASPDTNSWELPDITPGLFSYPAHRRIAEAICALRDSGRRFHWRRVSTSVPVGLRPLVRALRYRAGIEAGLTAAISRLRRPARRSA